MEATANGEMVTSPSTLSQSDSPVIGHSGRLAVSFETEERRMPLHSGLSALIQAATSQLGHLADGVTSDAASDYTTHSSNADGYASSSDGDLRESTPTQTPTIVTEETNMKLAFPEILMTLLLDPQNSNILTFLPDGKFFAIRSKEFADDLMIRYFHVTSFDDFLELIQGWGFTRINSDDNEICAGIQVFRHPRFRKGSARDLCHIRYAQINSETRMSGISERLKLDCSPSDDSTNVSKRRLSPSHLHRDAEDLSQKQRIIEETSTSEQDMPSPSMGSLLTQSKSNDSGDTKPPSRRSSDDFRSYALAITTDKLNLHCGEDENDYSGGGGRHSIPLVDGGVEKATHTIVTNAIETLRYVGRIVTRGTI